MGARWVGTGFYDGSFGCVLEKVNPVEERKAKASKQTFRNVAKREPFARLRPSTIRQYARIAEPTTVGEVLEFGFLFLQQKASKTHFQAVRRL
jgi:hypothetical protein